MFQKHAYRLIWVGYVCVLIYIVLFKASRDGIWQFIEAVRRGILPGGRKVYLRPFESTMYFLRDWKYSYARWNVFGNILLFFPLGFLIGISCKGRKGFWLSCKLGFIISLCFEIIQFLYAIGEFDVDDIMLNIVGAMAGYGVVHILRRIRRYLNDSSSNSCE